MKSKEVLKLLKVTRPTLTKYVKNGLIKVEIKHNGQYEYDEKSVYLLLNKDVDRKTYLYSRVSTSKQKVDLQNQIDTLKGFCFSRGYKVDGIFSDVASGISFDKRVDFFKLLDEVVSGKVERVIITYKDRMSRVGFDLFYFLFKKYNCEILVMSEIGSPKLDSEEIFEEIVSLLHCFSMKMYSKIKMDKIKNTLKEDD